MNDLASLLCGLRARKSHSSIITLALVAIKLKIAGPRLTDLPVLTDFTAPRASRITSGAPVTPHNHQILHNANQLPMV